MLKCIGIGRTAEIFEIDDNKVLKLYFDNISNEVINTEFDINMALNKTNIPIANCYEIIKKENRTGIIFDKIDGITMMKSMSNSPFESIKYAEKLAHIHYGIHKEVDFKLPDNKEKLKEKIDSVELLNEQDKNKLYKYIDLLPNQKKLCHGDFHPENILVTPNKTYVIDWMTATIGNPCSDIAHTDLLLRYGVSPDKKHGIEKFITNIVKNQFANKYINTYIRLSKVNINEVKKWKIPHLASILNDVMSNSTKKKILKNIHSELKYI